MTLTEFLFARIAQEDVPRESLHDHATCALFREKLAKECTCGWPARALAEAEAKRRIVEYTEATPTCTTHVETRTPGCPECIAADLVKKYDAQVLMRVALPYADHPDYDESWRP